MSTATPEVDGPRAEETPGPDQLDGELADEAGGGERRLAVAVVATITAVVVICRGWVVSAVVIPKGPDVIGPWAAAFQIAGADPAIDMRALPPYSVGMGAVLAPLVPLVRDPLTRYRVAVVMFLGFALLAGWFATRFLRRLGTVDALALALAYATTVGLTSVAYSSSFSWAEPLAFVWLACCLALVGRAIGRANLSAELLLAVFCGTAPLVHGRFTLVPPIWVAAHLLFVVLDVRAGRRSTKQAALSATAIAVVTALVMVASMAFRLRIIEAAWSEPNLANDTSILPNLPNPLYWRAILLETAGQLWYLTASTAGLGLLGLYALTRTALGRSEDRTLVARRVATLALVILGSVFLISVLFIASALITLEPSRLDYIVYGRYADQVVVLLAAIGAGHLVRSMRRSTSVTMAAGVAIFAVLSGIAWLIRSKSAEAPVAVNPEVISGVAALPFDRPGLDIVRWTMVACFALLLLGAARLVGRRVLAATLVILLSFGTVFGTAQAMDGHRAWDNSVLYEHYPSAPRRLTHVAVAQDAFDGMAYQFNFPSQQYALADLGWEFEVLPDSSADLRSDVGNDTGMVVLKNTAGEPEGSWCHMDPYDQIVVWVRLNAVANGVDGGPCDTLGP